MREVSKLSETFQRWWKEQPIYDDAILKSIDNRVQLHTEINNVRSSAATCINTIGNIAKNKKDLIAFLNKFNIKVEEIIPFPTGASFGGEVYRDLGNVVFEWIGPKQSPLNEIGGRRGLAGPPHSSNPGPLEELEKIARYAELASRLSKSVRGATRR